MNNRPESDLIEYVQLRAEWATLADRTESLKKKLDAAVEGAKTFEEIADLKLVEQEYLRAQALSEEVAAVNLPKLVALYGTLTAIDKLSVAHYDKLRTSQTSAVASQTTPLSVNTSLGLFSPGLAVLISTDQEDQHIVSETNAATCLKL